MSSLGELNSHLRIKMSKTGIDIKSMGRGQNQYFDLLDESKSGWYICSGNSPVSQVNSFVLEWMIICFPQTIHRVLVFTVDTDGIQIIHDT